MLLLYKLAQQGNALRSFRVTAVTEYTANTSAAPMVQHGFL